MFQPPINTANEMAFPHYGEIWDVNLDPVVGSEIGRRRPALLVSNDSNNKYSPRVTALPITSQSIDKEYPFEVTVPKGTGGLTADSRILANQIRTIDKKRLVSLRGVLPAQYFPRIERAMKVHLNMK